MAEAYIFCHIDIDVTLPDQQLQLFQAFHLWQALPGFSFKASLRLFQKEDSFLSALLLIGFILFHLLSSVCIKSISE
jgi:hypothetical protein